MQEMYELKLGLIRECRATFISDWNSPLLHRLGVSWGANELAVTSSMKELAIIRFLKTMKWWVCYNLQAPIEHEEETTKEGLENDMSFNSGVEQEIMNIFHELLNQTRLELYSDSSEFFRFNTCLVCWVLNAHHLEGVQVVEPPPF